jgi:hypothetical protein
MARLTGVLESQNKVKIKEPFTFQNVIPLELMDIQG